jgi:hypothetical protein
MRQGICRALLVLALLVPLSRYSFGDPFGASGTLQASGDIEGGSLTLPSFTFSGNSGATWALFNNIWTVGDSVQPSFGVEFSDGGGWTLNGVSGLMSYGTFSIDVTDPFTVEASPNGGLIATGIPIIWTGQIDLLSDNGIVLYDIDLDGTGTTSFTAQSFNTDQFLITGADAIVTDDAVVTPEPSTLTLMGIAGIAGIASIVGIQFRRRSKLKKAPVATGSALA